MNTNGEQMPTIRGPVPDVRACRMCPLNPSRAKAVTGIGPAKPKFCLIGEGPGRFEVQQNTPFVGRSGQMVQQALRAIGVDRKDIWITNTTLCLPPSMSTKDKDVAEAAEHCRARLIAELKSIGNIPIVTLGRFAAQAFIGTEFKITQIAGSFHKVKVGSLTREVIPTIHPAAILRGGGGMGGGDAHSPDLLYWGLLYDIAKANRLADGAAIRFTDDIQTEIVNRKRANTLVMRFLAHAREVGEFAVDFETPKVKPATCKICRDCRGHEGFEGYYVTPHLIGLATVERGISVAWGLLSNATQVALANALADKTLAKDFHNRLFDRIVSARQGMPVEGPIHCTLLLHHNAFPGMEHDLERVGTQFFCTPPWKSTFRASGKEGVTKEEAFYCGKDSLVTARLKPVLLDGVKRAKADKTYEMDLKMAEVAEEMTQVGIPIDLNVQRALYDYMAPLVQTAYDGLADKLDDEEFSDSFFEYLATEKARKARKDDSSDFDERFVRRLGELKKKFNFSLNAHQHVAAYLQAAGVPLAEKTDSGATSTKKEVLEAWAVSSKDARDILNYRKFSKLVSTFVRPIPQLIDRNGRLHTIWSVNKITSRWGSSPNAQNWSKGKVVWGDVKAHTFENWLKLPDNQKGVPNLRWMVVAPKGKVLVGADQAQLEARVVALLSGDDYLCKAFREGIDIHSEFLKELFPAEWVKWDADWFAIVRDYVKRAEYGYLYGAAEEKVYETLRKEGLDVTRADIHRMFVTFQKRMPKVGRWHGKLYKEVLQTGSLRTPIYERRRDFPLGNAEDTVIKNFVVQTTGTEIVNTALWEFYKRKPAGCHILIHGHDAFDVECYEKDGPAVAKLMEACMTREYTVNGVTVPFKAKAVIGHSWGEV